MNQSLKLPQRAITGFSGASGYLGTPFNWTGRLPRAAERNLWPVAWTPYLQGLGAGQSEAVWIPSHVFVNPPFWFPAKYFHYRKPKIVLCDFTAFPGINVVNILGPITGFLLQENVMVAIQSISFQNNFDAIYRHFLPHEGVVSVSHFVPLIGGVSGTFGTCNPLHWTAGQVLYLAGLSSRDIDNFGQHRIFCPGSVSIPNNGILEELAEWNAFGITQIANQRTRYDQFGYHMIYALASAYGTVPGWASGGFRAFQRAVVPSVVAATGGAAAGVTLDIFDEAFGPLNQAAIEVAFRNRIVNFFLQ